MMFGKVYLLFWFIHININADPSLNSLLEHVESESFVNRTFRGATYASDNIMKTLLGDGRITRHGISIPSPFSFYLDAIRNVFFQDMREHQGSAEIIVKFPCSSQVVSEMTSKISDIKVHSHCHQLYRKLDPYETFTVLNSEVSTAILMVPWYLTEFYLSMYHSQKLAFVTVEVSPHLIRSLQARNPFLQVTNLRFDAERKEPGMMNHSKTVRLTPSNCVKTYEKQANKTKLRHKVQACHDIPTKTVNIVTRYRDKFVFPSLYVKPKNGKCDVGVLCKEFRHVVYNTEVWDSLCCIGQEIEMLQRVMEIVNLPYNVYFVKDGKFGSYKYGKWDGMINDLVIKRADVAMYQFTILPKRLEFVEFAHKILFYRVPVGLVIKKENNAFKVASWASLSYVELIYVIFIPIMIAVIILFVIGFENIGYFRHFNDRYKYRASFTYMASIVFERDVGGKPPKRWPGRITAIMYSFTMTIFIGYYTAQITATNIYYQKNETFKGLDDIRLRSPKFKLGLHRSSYYEEILNGRPEIKATRVYITSWVNSVADVNNGLLDGTIGSSISMESIISKKSDYCKNLILHLEEKYNEGEAWAYQKGSFVGEMISRTILQLVENEEINQIREKWADMSMCGIGKKANAFPWQYAIGPLVVLSGAVGFCLLIYPFEYVYVLWKRTKVRCYAI